MTRPEFLTDATWQVLALFLPAPPSGSRVGSAEKRLRHLVGHTTVPCNIGPIFSHTAPPVTVTLSV